MKLQFFGLLRRTVRNAKTPKGAAFLVVGVILGLFWVASAVMPILLGRPASDPVKVRAVLPVALMGFAFLSAVAHGGDRAVAFSPAEVNFLFPGPFTRRELLLFKLGKGFAAAVLTSLFFSLFLLQFATLWLACYVGLVLSFLFLQYASTAFVLTGQTAAAPTAKARWRRVVLLAAVAAILVAVAPAARSVWMTSDWSTFLPTLESSRLARVVLAPARPATMAWTAQSYGALLAWGALAAAIDAALLLLVLRLDANLLDLALDASHRLDARMTRLKDGQFLALSGDAARRRHVPELPRLGGAGPIAWRQLSTASRSGGRLLLFAAIFCVAGIPGAVIGGKNGGAAAVLPMVAWLTFIFSATMKLDFRADLDRMDVLKALPLRPTAVAAGQMAAPVFVLALMHVVVLGVLAVFVPLAERGGGRAVIGWALAMALPLDVLLIGVENLVFLLLPARPAAATPGDLSAMGRHAMLFLLKGILLLVAVGLAAGAGVGVYFATGRSVPAAGATSTAVLAAMSLAVVPMVGWAFGRFDPSVDVPA